MFDRHRSDSSQLTYVFGKKEKIRFKVIPRGYSYLGTNEIVHTSLGVFSVFLKYFPSELMHLTY